MIILSTRDSDWLRQCEAALLADGIVVSVVRDPTAAAPRRRGRAPLHVDVPVSESERASDILSDDLRESYQRLRLKAQVVPVASSSLLLNPEFAVAVGMAVLLLSFAWVTGSLNLSSPWFRQGALIVEEAWRGEWWRLVTAATLHADGEHALGNAAFFLVLGWGAAERIGGGAMIAIFILTAIGGFVVSMGFSSGTLTVGASGGLFGLLGVAGGHGARAAPVHGERMHHRTRMIGAAIMLLAFTAFSPRSNIWAHVGGFATGLPLGFVIPLAMPSWRWQIAAAALSAGLVAWAWALALG